MNKVIIIGGGIAGLSAAISSRNNGANVVLISKSYPTKSQSSMAQGGINCAFESIETQIQDTLKSSKGLGNKEAIELMCKRGILEIENLLSYGAPFDREPSGELKKRKLGGASIPYALCMQDFTGLKILHTLYDKALFLGVEFINDTIITDLLVDEDICYGVAGFYLRSGTSFSLQSNSTILATGGYAKIYGSNSTNGFGSVGEGIALAKEVGANLKGMEFIQFHPTALASSSILISEGARAEGGIIINEDNERFIDELATRDEVARGVYEMLKSGKKVYLDIRHLPQEVIYSRLPQEAKLAKIYENIDVTKEPIPIKPAAHYSMGGIEVDLDCKTSIKNLYACGECANHNTHGANRLGGNSLLEALAFGAIAGENSANAIEQNIKKDFKITPVDNLLAKEGEESIYELKKECEEINNKYLSLVRNEGSLKMAMLRISELKERFKNIGFKNREKIFNTELQGYFELRAMLLVSLELANSAERNKKSIGAHFRSDG